MQNDDFRDIVTETEDQIGDGLFQLKFVEFFNYSVVQFDARSLNERREKRSMRCFFSSHHVDRTIEKRKKNLELLAYNRFVLSTTNHH